jgi:hypothetical protein
MKVISAVAFSFACLPLRAFAQDDTQNCGHGPNFSSCILAAVQMIHTSREHLGYGKAYFTRDLDYGPFSSVIKASPLKPKTMCVAAVTEVAIEALNIYYRNTHDRTPFDSLAYSHWNHSTALDIRDYVWENRGSHSAGYAFEKFGIGRQLDFTDLKPGDFLSFDRGNGGGHSVIFISFLDKNYNELSAYSANVVGFKYYSSQSTYVPGFAYRWAFFQGADGGNVCRIANTHPEKARDCFGGGVVRSSVRGRGGRLHMPSQWQAGPAANAVRQSLVASVRPTIEQKFSAMLDTSAGILRQNPNSNVLLSQSWSTVLNKSPQVLQMFSDQKSRKALATQPAKRDELRRSESWSALISGAVDESLAQPNPNPVQAKFLPPLN